MARTGGPIGGDGGLRGLRGIGMVGLGAMGRPMAANLLARFPGRVHLTGRDRTRHADLVEAGATWQDSAKELAEVAEVVVLMLPDLPEVEAVLSGPQGLLAARPDDLLLVISSTSSPTGVRDLAARLQQDHPGVAVVDAPVSGGVDGAEAGTLSIMVGGADADVARAEPVLAACGTPVHLGPLGSGQVAKACNQLIVAATVLALGEAAVLADRSGLDLPALFELFAGGYADSRILRTRGPRIVEQDYSPSGVARYMVKDLGFATAVATNTQTHPVLLPAVRAAFEHLTATGFGDQDISVTRAYIEERHASDG